MPVQEVLILAMTRMRSGICTAGFLAEPDPVTGLRWVRPVRDFETLLPGDMTDHDGRLIQCSDVVELCLLSPRPDPPHVEDWLVDCTHHRPRLLRQLCGNRRSDFLAKYLDQTPLDVLVAHTRSLCLVQPSRVWAEFSQDAYSSKYQARMGFELGADTHCWTTGHKGPPVTDLKWRALGRRWLDAGRAKLTLQHDDLLQRLNAQRLYLTVGLSRSWQGQYWPMVVGVHADPDYEASVDPDLL